MTNSSWLSHVKKTMYDNAGISLTQILKRANKTYKKKKGGGKKKIKKTKTKKSRKKNLNKKNKKIKRKKK
tara:strand:- start:6408 stop:6617 length:210 start_codon:yes stop_codon:yes gene_type:complete